MFQVHFPSRRSIGKNHNIITIIFRIFGQRYFINSRFAGIDTHRSFPFDIGSLSMSKSDSLFIVDINLRNPRVETHHFNASFPMSKFMGSPYTLSATTDT